MRREKLGGPVAEFHFSHGYWARWGAFSSGRHFGNDQAPFVRRYLYILKRRHTYVPSLVSANIPGALALLSVQFLETSQRWRLATSVCADELVAVLEKLSTPPGGSLPDPAQRAMLVIAGEAQSGARSKVIYGAEFDKFVRDFGERRR